MRQTTKTLEKKIAKSIIKSVSDWFWIIKACKRWWISVPTFYMYLDNYNLRHEYNKAKTDIIYDALKTINKAVKFDAKIALEVLKRRDKKIWSEKTEIKHEWEIKWWNNRITSIQLIWFDEYERKKEENNEETDK